MGIGPAARLSKRRIILPTSICRRGVTDSDNIDIEKIEIFEGTNPASNPVNLVYN